MAVIALLAGLLGMHVLGLHGTSDRHGMPDAAAVTHSMTTDAAESADVGASAALQSSGDHGSSADSVMAALCVLALLAGILLLRRPVLRGGQPLPGILLRAVRAVPLAPRPPSLDVLCISRR